MPAADEFGQELPEFALHLFVPAVDGHEPVAALDGSERAGGGDGVEEGFQWQSRGDVGEGECEMGFEGPVRGLGAGWVDLKGLRCVVWRWRGGGRIFGVR